jgi:hypothetical protein
MVRGVIWWSAGLAMVTAVAAPDPGMRSAPPPGRVLTPSLSVSLTGPELPVLSGGRVSMSVVLSNRGERPVNILQPIDGCDCGWRPVRYQWSVTTQGREVERVGYARCGNVNAIEPSDFLTLRPGESFQPTSWIDSPDQFFDLTEPGDYQVSLTYQFDTILPKRGVVMGERTSEVSRLLAAVDVLTVRSTPITVRVVPLPPHLKEALARLKEARVAVHAAEQECRELPSRHPNPTAEERKKIADAETRLQKATEVYQQTTEAYFQARDKYEAQRRQAAGPSDHQP